MQVLSGTSCKRAREARQGQGRNKARCGFGYSPASAQSHGKFRDKGQGWPQRITPPGGKEVGDFIPLD